MGIDYPSTKAPPERSWITRFALHALDASVNAIAFADLRGDLTYVNRRFLKLWGYDEEAEVLGRPAATFWRSQTQAEEVIRHLQTRGGWFGEMVAITRGGAEKPVELSASLIVGDDGAPVGMMGSFVDISDRKNAEHELQRFKFMVEGSSEEIYLARADGTLVYANPAAARSLGYSVEELAAMNVTAFDHEYGSKLASLLEAIRARRLTAFEVVHTTRDGRRVSKEAEASRLEIDGEELICGFVRDISVRKKHEARIAALTRLYALLSQVNQAIVRVREEAALFREICRVAIEFGQFRGAWIGLLNGGAELRLVASAGGGIEFVDRFAAERSPDDWSPTREATATGAIVASDDLLAEPRESAWRDAALRAGHRSFAILPLVVRGAVIGALSLYDSAPNAFTAEVRRLLDEVALDITFALETMAVAEERRRAEVALHVAEEQADRLVHSNEERLRQAVRVVNFGIFDHDHRTDTIYWSPEQRAIHGWGADEPITLKQFLALVHPDDVDYVAAEVRRAHSPASDGRWDVEHRIVRRDGSVRWLRSRSQTSFEGEGDARHPVRTVGAVRDVTDERTAAEEKDRLHAQLAQAQKMESIGRLAGGVAHDFNNMLTVILGHAELALGELPSESPVRADLQEVEHAARRSADLTRQLLAFARRQAVTPRVLNLNDSIAVALKMLRRLIGEDVALSWSPGAELWSVKVDPSQVDQILANLVVNARDAIPGVGTVSIATKNIPAGAASLARFPDAAAKDHVRLTVRDSGAGMDPDTLAHAFEPFFTTKAEGHGTGLGLATVFGIVQQNEGHIDIDSQPGAGTTVTIHLPRSIELVANQRDGSATPGRSRGAETILLVEDEIAVLELTQTLLKRLGYQVIAARSPREALRLVDEHGPRIRLLVTDVVMPEMNGRDLWNAVVARLPDLRGLFISAHPASILSTRGILDADVNFLQKPFTTAELATAVLDALGADNRTRAQHP